MKIDVSRQQRTMRGVGAHAAPYVPEVEAPVEKASPFVPSRHTIAQRVPSFLRDEFRRWGIG